MAYQLQGVKKKHLSRINDIEEYICVLFTEHVQLKDELQIDKLQVTV